IRSLPHVAEVVPFATVGWQPIDVQVPVELRSRGIYRVSARWIGQGVIDSEIVRYVDVTDLSQFTNESTLTASIVTHLIAKTNTSSVVFPMSVQAIQAVIGIPMSQQAILSQVLLEGMASA